MSTGTSQSRLQPHTIGVRTKNGYTCTRYGYSIVAHMQTQDIALIITDLAVNYKAEAFMFDELIIETHIGETAPKGFRMFHRVRRGPSLVALVEAGVATYNYALKKTAPVPAEFLERLALRHEKA